MNVHGYQLYWRGWCRLWPKWTRYRDRSYGDLYPDLELYAHFFCWGPLQTHWWECVLPLRRTKTWSEGVKKLLREDLEAVAYSH